MRKNTARFIDAFINAKETRGPRDRVEVDGTVVRWYLHHNLIAKRDAHILTVSHCNWKTPTTKDRLNEVLYAYGLPRLYQRNFLWYFTDGNDFTRSKVSFNIFTKERIV